MKFFNIDLHISVVADIKTIVESMGHSVDSQSLSGHSWVFGKSRDHVKVINHRNWKHLNQKMCDDFYEAYREKLAHYDVFIVTHTPSFALLYEKFNKPIIVVASTRYECPFMDNKALFIKLNSFLTQGIETGRILLLSNNKYDANYVQYFLGKDIPVIPSLCEYTKMHYTGKKERFLLFSKCKSLPKIKNVYDKDTQFKYRLFRKGYDWQELADFKGIIHIPYNASTMSIFEQYTANIPLFFPSKSFLRELFSQYSTQGVLSELSYNQVFGLPARSLFFDGTQTDDPNNYTSVDTVMKWIEFADFYDADNMPHITYFDSFEHLEVLLETTDLQSVSDKMKEYNSKRKEVILSKWQNTLYSLKI